MRKRIVVQRVNKLKTYLLKIWQTWKAYLQRLLKPKQTKQSFKNANIVETKKYNTSPRLIKKLPSPGTIYSERRQMYKLMYRALSITNKKLKKLIKLSKRTGVKIEALLSKQN